MSNDVTEDSPGEDNNVQSVSKSKKRKPSSEAPKSPKQKQRKKEIQDKSDISSAKESNSERADHVVESTGDQSTPSDKKKNKKKVLFCQNNY